MTSGSVSVRGADAIARLAKLLDHPIRVRLVAALATEGLGSATTLADRCGDVTVGDCHYHLTVLRDGGAIELVHSRPVRGATERVYRLRPWSRWRGAQQFRGFVDLLLPVTNSNKKLLAMPRRSSYERSAKPADD